MKRVMWLLVVTASCGGRPNNGDDDGVPGDGSGSGSGSYEVGAYCDNRNVPAHALVDMNGTGVPDLVVTERCNDTSIDVDHWLVYPATCAN